MRAISGRVCAIKHFVQRQAGRVGDWAMTTASDQRGWRTPLIMWCWGRGEGAKCERPTGRAGDIEHFVLRRAGRMAGEGRTGRSTPAGCYKCS